MRLFHLKILSQVGKTMMSQGYFRKRWKTTKRDELDSADKHSS